MEKLSVIIVAAGSSRRMGFDKLMAPLLGKPVLQHSMETFLRLDCVERLILVSPQERLEQLEIPADLTHKLIRVDGGNERHHSVMQGLQALPEDAQWVAVHDGARPLISAEQTLATFEAAREHRAATSGRRITDTVKRTNDDQKISESVDRENLWSMETPQIFSRTLLDQAYAKVTQEALLVTDEVSALEHVGVATYIQPNHTPNLKVTFPEDIEMASILLQHYR